jgi:hypothetical protein
MALTMKNNICVGVTPYDRNLPASGSSVKGKVIPGFS